VSPDSLRFDGMVCERRYGCEGGRTLGRRHAGTRGALHFPWLRAPPTSSAGEAEKAIAAKSEALEPTACGKAGAG